MYGSQKNVFKKKATFYEQNTMHVAPVLRPALACLTLYTFPWLVFWDVFDRAPNHLSGATQLDTRYDNERELRAAWLTYLWHLAAGVGWLLAIQTPVAPLLRAPAARARPIEWGCCGSVLVLAAVRVADLALSVPLLGDLIVYATFLVDIVACADALRMAVRRTQAGAERTPSSPLASWIAATIATFYVIGALTNFRTSTTNPGEWHALFSATSYVLSYVLLLCLRTRSVAGAAVLAVTLPCIVLYNVVQGTRPHWIVTPGYLVEVVAALGVSAAFPLAVQ